jgi:hypothetical protein
MSLRVSTATLARVLFPHPDTGATMLALEHKATVHHEGHQPQVVVRAQPFGGAVRILRPEKLQEHLGGFNYDSERSRRDQDFRIFIHPSSWKDFLDCCVSGLAREEIATVESDPTRELEEEFADALGIRLKPAQYETKRGRFVVEKKPAPTANVRARGDPTARVYWVDEVRIQDPGLCRSMLAISETLSAEDLREQAFDDDKYGGHGRANGMYTALLTRVCEAYLAVPLDQRAEPLPFDGTLLSGNVPAVLEDILSPKFEIVQP